MKRSLAWMAAFVIGLSVCSLEAGAAETAERRTEAITTLEIPQKLEVVIDPWELDGKGQVYSESYTLRNTGETAGTLILNFACKPSEGSEVSVRKGKEGLHGDELKSVYIKAVFGDGTEMVLSQDYSKYQIELQPKEELSVRFEGEVNENASAGWESSGIKVEGLYSWKTREEVSNEAEEEKALEASEAENRDEFSNANDRNSYVTPSNAKPDEPKIQEPEDEEHVTAAEDAPEEKKEEIL